MMQAGAQLQGGGYRGWTVEASFALLPGSSGEKEGGGLING